MKKRRLGANGPEVSAIGLGCMAMSVNAYGAPDPDEALATLKAAIDNGLNFFDTAGHYGDGSNEELIAEAIRGRRAKTVIGSKFGTIIHDDGSRGVSGRPDLIPAACEASLKRLGTDYIDIYYLHRIDPDVPIEETVGGMARLVEAGKVRHLGLCEAAPATLRRACAVHPITALQTEYSLWSRDAETELFETCAELGIGFVAYSPLGHGFLTAAVKDMKALDEGDNRRRYPRFQDANFKANLALLKPLEEIANAHHVAPVQISLAWILAKGRHLVPIPGTTRRGHLMDIVEAADITLDQSEVERLDQTFSADAPAGERWPPGVMRRLNR
jgi:aryl-alcohol dehydrogenase-like predicted oxidoreductase